MLLAADQRQLVEFSETVLRRALDSLTTPVGLDAMLQRPVAVLALFPSRPPFEALEPLLSEAAGVGAFVIVGFPGATTGSTGYVQIDSTGIEEVDAAIVLVVVGSPATCAMVAVADLFESVEASRDDKGSYTVRLSFDAGDVVAAASQLLRPLRGHLEWSDRDEFRARVRSNAPSTDRFTVLDEAAMESLAAAIFGEGP